MTKEQRENWFTYHAPTPDTAPKYAQVRDAERAFIANVTQAEIELTKARMQANSAIACGGVG